MYNNYGDFMVRAERRSSDMWRETGTVRQDDDRSSRHDDDHGLIMRQREDDEQSELSFSSAFGTPRNIPHSLNQHRETSV